MARLLRWTRPLRRVAARLGVLRDPLGPVTRAVARWLDAEARAAFERSDVPGLAVVVRLPDGREVARHFGTAGGGTPLVPETRFQVLSLTKPVTAMLALALVDDGRVTLDAPLLPAAGWTLPRHRTGGFDPDAITLRRVLSHDAGLSVKGYGWTDAGTSRPARELLDLESDPERTLRLVARPGSGLRYSGGGFTLVEQLVEHGTGARFPEVARRRLLAPLGISASGYEPSQGLSPSLSERHDEAGRVLPRAGVASTGSSGLVATASDLARLWSVPSDGRRGAPAGAGVLSPNACAAMLTPHAADAAGATCGLGVFVNERRGELRYAHVGHDPGWTHHAEGLRRRGAVTVVLANRSGAETLVDPIARGIRARLLDGLP